MIVLVFASDTISRGTIQTADADTIGTNTDVFEAGASVWSPWWSGYGGLIVTQRYGCTVDPQAASYEDYAPECPAPYPAGDPRNNRWHQGMDIDTRGGSINLTAAIEGTVADFSDPGCYACSGLGYLAIRSLGGNIVYLLHGRPTGSFQSNGVKVHLGDATYITGANGADQAFLA